MDDQIVLYIALVGALAMFIWGRWRYDIVAIATLLIVVVAGIVPSDEAFLGFAHPAVITVAAVLVVSNGLHNAGVVDALAVRFKAIGSSITLQVLALTGLTAVCSAFMNNVGALAILMPVAVQMARSAGRPPSLLLMPIAFGSLLGGMCTLIGTPPNIIIAAHRADEMGQPYRMFDFLAVGAAVTTAGVLMCAGLWRLLPRREPGASRDALFDIEHYVAEMGVEADTKADGALVRDLGEQAEGEVTVIGIARGKRQIRMPAPHERLAAGDILIVEADADTMKAVADAFGLKIEGDEDLRKEFLTSGEIALAECIVLGDSPAAGRTAIELDLRRGHGINLLGIARQGKRMGSRLGRTPLRAGDVLLVQGAQASISATLAALAWLPLAEREIRLARPRRIALALALLAGAIVSVVAGLLSVQVAFTACACLMVLVGLVNPRNAYDAVDWPIIVLLGAMIPVGTAMETTGGAGRIAELMLAVGGSVPPWLAVGLHMATCMALSNVINNAAAAVLMAPIAVALASGLDASLDPFLMATAVGASAAFLTPIGHQSNTLVMGPGGYRFSDFLRLGVPCSAITIIVGTPAILWRWPLEIAPG
jgi:di/tricarboxylate transporter